jgi:uncharacterized protein
MIQPTNNISPTKAINRIYFLDALRGIAVLFIFTANITVFSGFFFMKDANSFEWAVFPFDETFEMILHTLVDGKFYTIFSLLFGIGFTIQYENLKKRGLPFKPFFRRRMFWLFIFGGIHLSLIWLGDILTLYAILGFALLNFVETKNKNLLKWAVVLILLPILNTIVIRFLNLDYATFFLKTNEHICNYFTIPTSKFRDFKMTDLHAQFQNQNLLTFFKTTICNSFIRIGFILYEGRPFKVLGIFLIGIWAGRKIIHENLLNNTTFLKKVALYGILFGLPINILRSYLEIISDGSKFSQLYTTIAYALGTVPFALGIAASLALLYLKRSSLFKYFEPVGKMALTNYISHSIISIAVFYGIGFGFAGKFGFTFLILYCSIVFIFQIIFSILWLKEFKIGPLEWVWRKFTYTK